MQHRKKGQPRQLHMRLGNNNNETSLQQQLADEVPSNSLPDVICEVVADVENDVEKVAPDVSCKVVADVENDVEPLLVDDVSNEDKSNANALRLKVSLQPKSDE